LTPFRDGRQLDDDSHVGGAAFRLNAMTASVYESRRLGCWFPVRARRSRHNRAELVTNSNIATSRVRNAALILFALAFGLPILVIAQEPPASGQGKKEDPPKGAKDDGGGKKEPSDEEKAKIVDALKKLKDEKQKESGAAPPTKSVDMSKAGAVRKKLEDVRNIQRLPEPQPTNPEKNSVLQCKASPATVKKWARYQLSLFTDPNQDKNVQKNHEDVLRAVSDNLEPNCAQLMKKELFAACDWLLKHESKVSSVAKVNALSLVDELHGKEVAAGVTGVQVILDALKDHERHGDAVLYVAMTAMRNAKKLRVAKVAQEREAAKLLMNIARRGEIQPLLLEELCRTLGHMEVPFEGLEADRAEIATFLANIATNENLDERTRFEAAIALGRLKKQNQIPSYAYEVEAWVLAKAYLSYVNWVVAAKAAEKPLVSDGVIKYIGARLSDAIRHSLDQATGAPGQNRLRTLYSTIEPSLKDIWDGREPDREPIVQWLEQNRVPSMKLARKAVDIQPIAKAAPPAPPAGGAAADK
jgi:hypothetical protein